MLSDLAPCFAKVYTVTPQLPPRPERRGSCRRKPASTRTPRPPTVYRRPRKAVDYADENNLAGVVVCGSLYLAAEARPLASQRSRKITRLPPFQQNKHPQACIITVRAFLFAAIGFTSPFNRLRGDSSTPLPLSRNKFHHRPATLHSPCITLSNTNTRGATFPMAKVTLQKKTRPKLPIPGSGTAAYLSGEIDHHAAQSLRRRSMPRSMTAFPNF